MNQQNYNKFQEVSGNTIKIGIGVLVSLVAIGTVGYHLIEGWEIIDCLYMTIITIATVGFKEVGPLSTGGKIFTMGLIVTSLKATWYFYSYEKHPQFTGRSNEWRLLRFLQILC